MGFSVPIADKLKLLTNPVALKRLEQELDRIQSDIDKLQARRQALAKQKPVDFSQLGESSNSWWNTLTSSYSTRVIQAKKLGFSDCFSKNCQPMKIWSVEPLKAMNHPS